VHTFSYPAMPMYSHDHHAYVKQMYDWHMKMHHYHEQKKAHHLERAKHFQQFMRVNVAMISETDSPKEGIA